VRAQAEPGYEKCTDLTLVPRLRLTLVPRLRLGTHCLQGSAFPFTEVFALSLHCYSANAGAVTQHDAVVQDLLQQLQCCELNEPKLDGSLVIREAEPPRQCVPRQSLGTR